MWNCVEEIREELQKDGAIEQLSAFNEAYDKLKGNWAEQAVFAFDVLCNLKGIPNNNGTPEWSAYVATGSKEEWKRVREERLTKTREEKVIGGTIERIA